MVEKGASDLCTFGTISKCRHLSNSRQPPKKTQKAISTWPCRATGFNSVHNRLIHSLYYSEVSPSEVPWRHAEGGVGRHGNA